MPPIKQNPDLPLSYRIPGVKAYINPNSPGNGSGDISHRHLILGERNSAGAALGANAIYPALSEQDVIDNSGRGSAAHLQYVAAVSQAGAGAVDWFVGHVDQASGGTAAIYPFVFAGPATGTGQVNMRVAGRLASVGFVSGDTATTIAAALDVELDKLTDLPLTFNASSGTLTGTHRHKAAHGEDVPVSFSITPGKGVSVGPGTAQLATNAAGAGSIRLVNGTTTITASISNADTPAVIAEALRVATNLSDGVFTMTVDGAGAFTPSYVNDRIVRRTTAQIVTSTGTTINWNGSGAIAAGTVAPAGTIGLGSPTITTLIANIAIQSGFGRWSCPWTDVTTLGLLATEIELEGDGQRQKNQTLHVCSVAALATAGAIPTGTSPALTGSLRYVVHHFPDAPQMGYEYAARSAAARAANDRPARNWNGYALKTNASVPLMGVHRSQRATDADINSAINTYFLDPIWFDEASGKSKIVYGRNTSNSSDRALHDWSATDQLDKQRYETIARHTAQWFSDTGGVSRMSSGTPFTEGVIDLASIEDFQYELTVEWERNGYYDGADALKGGISATVNGGDPTRIDLVYTASIIVPVHIISVVANRGSAPAAQ